jgi:hypothetical protein
MRFSALPNAPRTVFGENLRNLHVANRNRSGYNSNHPVALT